MGVLPFSQILVAALSIITFPTVTDSRPASWAGKRLPQNLCFCNSLTCPDAVCKTTQRCFVKLLRTVIAEADGNVSTSVLYGCTETLGSNECSNSSHVTCCDKQMCNMPNRLRGTTQVDQNSESKERIKCPVHESAMRVASVVVPSVLILTVILLSLALFYKLSQYQRNTAIQREIKCGDESHERKLFRKVHRITGWKPLHTVRESHHCSAVDVSHAMRKETTVTVNCSVNEFCGFVTPPDIKV